jgi:hypothetical protein
MQTKTTTSAKQSPVMTTTNKPPRRRPAVRAPRPRSSLARNWAPAILATFFGIGCGPEFDPSSLVTTTRVIGARVEASGTEDRASPAPGENANVTWLITAPATVPPLQWAFALCLPGHPNTLACGDTPFAVFTGSGNPPVIPIAVPTAETLGGSDRVLLTGRICDDSAPVFAPGTGYPACASGHGTTASVTIGLQTTPDANHNPKTDRGFTLDGQDWPVAAAGADPCAAGPTVVAGTEEHLLGLSTVAADRESYTTLEGDPPVPTPTRESLQISGFTTSGKLKSPFAFVEAVADGATTPVELKWDAPLPRDVAAPTPVTFTFVTRDNRGGADWATRTACVTPAP